MFGKVDERFVMVCPGMKAFTITQVVRTVVDLHDNPAFCFQNLLRLVDCHHVGNLLAS